MLAVVSSWVSCGDKVFLDFRGIIKTPTAKREDVKNNFREFLSVSNCPDKAESELTGTFLVYVYDENGSCVAVHEFDVSDSIY